MNQKRSQYFIDPAFQTRFIVKFCLVVIVASLLAGLLIFFLTQNSTTVSIENTKVLVKRTSDFIGPVLTITAATVTLFSALVVMLITLLQSHRIAGPMFRLRREIQGLGQGNLDQNFLIRNRDQFQPLSCALDEMNRVLRDKIGSVQNQFGALELFFKERNLPLPGTDKERLKSLLQEISAGLNYFKV